MIFFLLATASSQPVPHIGGAADVVEHLEHFFVGAAVQRAGQRADGELMTV